MERVALMSENLTESNLLAQCRQGSRAALQTLFAENQKRVFSVALNFFGGDHAAAEDVTQQVFLKIFNNIGHFRAESEFTTWLYRITVNTCLDEQRRSRRFVRIAEIFGFAEPRANRAQDEKLYQTEISSVVQKAVAELKPKFRLPILLRYSEGLSYEEIAKVLDCSAGTVASRLNRGHKMLAEKLGYLKGEI